MSEPSEELQSIPEGTRVWRRAAPAGSAVAIGFAAGGVLAQWCGLITLVVGDDRGWASWVYFAVLVALMVSVPIIAWLAFGRRYVDYTVVHGGVYQRPRGASAWQLVKRISGVERIHLLGNIEAVWFHLTSATSYEQIGSFPKREGMAFYDAILDAAADLGVSLETIDERASIPRTLKDRRADLRKQRS